MFFKSRKPENKETDKSLQVNVDLEIVTKMNQEFAVSLDLNDTLKTSLHVIIARINAQAANIFLINDSCIITPDLKSGCLNGVMRKNIIRILKKNNIQIVERDVNTYELSDADEIFGCNSIQGIFSITKYRKNELKFNLTKKILDLLNASV